MHDILSQLSAACQNTADLALCSQPPAKKENTFRRRHHEGNGQRGSRGRSLVLTVEAAQTVAVQRWQRDFFPECERRCRGGDDARALRCVEPSPECIGKYNVKNTLKVNTPRIT